MVVDFPLLRVRGHEKIDKRLDSTALEHICSIEKSVGLGALGHYRAQSLDLFTYSCVLGDVRIVETVTESPRECADVIQVEFWRRELGGVFLRFFSHC